MAGLVRWLEFQGGVLNVEDESINMCVPQCLAAIVRWLQIRGLIGPLEIARFHYTYISLYTLSLI